MTLTRVGGVIQETGIERPRSVDVYRDEAGRVSHKRESKTQSCESTDNRVTSPVKRVSRNIEVKGNGRRN